MKRAVAVVPHSHWDREWYAPFEGYRVRLTAMMDRLIGLLEDGRLDHFHLDGQVAAADDYLEARPGVAGRLAALVASGRLAVGPWYVLMDEFCVSGETILRNLELGLERAAELGAGAMTGYLPDMFGHVSQMPQILRLAGIDDAVVWRGVPAAVDSSAFGWEAPDGSRVAAELMPVGYASGAFLPKEPEALLRRLDAHEAEIGRFLGPHRPMLLMNGGDHQEPQEWVPRLVEAVNAMQSRFDLHLTSLATYLANRTDHGDVVWRGELRSGARAPILMGVLSNRVDIKQAAAAAEALIEKQAEPLATLWLPPDLWPGDLLDRAWRQMIHNSAHDSICGCSADPVGRAVLSRYDTAAAIGASVVGEAAAIAGVATRAGGTVMVNPLPFDRTELVELDLPGRQPPEGTQQLSVTEAEVVTVTGSGADLASMLGRLTADGALGPSGRPAAVGLSEPGAPLIITLRSDPSRPADPQMAPVMAEAWARAGAGRQEPLLVRVEKAAAQRVLARSGPVPGWGWALRRPLAAEAADEDGLQVAAGPPVRVISAAMTVEVDGEGLVSVSGPSGTATGLNRIVEEADEGDTYNWSPAQDGRPPVDRPLATCVDVVEAGPLRAVVRVTRRYRWGEDPGPGAPVEVVTDVVVAAGDPVVRFTTTFDHTGRDHRIRAVFPLPRPAGGTVAECAFAAVERTTAEGGPMEPGLATFPSRRFVSAGGLTVFHSGLLEYELVEEGRALALTLLRAVGILSRPAPPARPNIAGPALTLTDAQLPGPRRFAYAVALGAGDPWALADRLAAPLVTVPAVGGGPLADQGRRLSIDCGGAKVSALRRRRGRIEIRLFNPSDTAVIVGLPGESGATVDLRGGETGRWEGSVRIDAYRVVTLRLDRSDLDRDL